MAAIQDPSMFRLWPVMGLGLISLSRDLSSCRLLHDCRAAAAVLYSLPSAFAYAPMFSRCRSHHSFFGYWYHLLGVRAPVASPVSSSCCGLPSREPPTSSCNTRSSRGFSGRRRLRHRFRGIGWVSWWVARGDARTKQLPGSVHLCSTQDGRLKTSPARLITSKRERDRGAESRRNMDRDAEGGDKDAETQGSKDRSCKKAGEQLPQTSANSETETEG